jgi:hypothetical protein
MHRASFTGMLNQSHLTTRGILTIATGSQIRGRRLAVFDGYDRGGEWTSFKSTGLMVEVEHPLLMTPSLPLISSLLDLPLYCMVNSAGTCQPEFPDPAVSQSITLSSSLPHCRPTSICLRVFTFNPAVLSPLVYLILPLSIFSVSL